jgi:hypothetical protein
MVLLNLALKVLDKLDMIYITQTVCFCQTILSLFYINGRGYGSSACKGKADQERLTKGI